MHQEQKKIKSRVVFESVIGIILLGILVYILLGKARNLDDDQRLILFFLLSLLPALIIGSEVQARFDIKLPGYVASTTGPAAVFFISLFLMNQIQRDDTVLIYKVMESGEDFILTGNHIIRVPDESNKREKGLYKDGNTLIIVLNKSTDVLPVEFFKHGLTKHCAIVSKNINGPLEIGVNLTSEICDTEEYRSL